MADAGRTKRELCERLLEGGMVMVFLDSRVEGIEVPEAHDGDPQLRLNLSHRFGAPMDLDDWGIKATLTFGGIPHQCSLPWEAIYVVFSHASGEPHVFPADVPPEVIALIDTVEPQPQPEESRPQLRVIHSEQDAEPTPEPPPEPPPDPPQRPRSHLRVVK